MVDGRALLDALLRAADRDHHKSQGPSAAAAVAEAKRAHRILSRGLTAKQGPSTDDAPVLSRCAALAPHLAVESGFLGRRAATAAREAGNGTSVAAINKGLAALQVGRTTCARVCRFA